MANQPTKYKKFVATAATATLVASAIVPVASAASFTDVSETNSHAEAINALVADGIINGYQDGTFKPNATLTRGHVVKMLGKWVEAQGFEIPADATTKQRFTDLSVTAADQELVKYAALVFDTEVFKGSAGKLNAGGDITRQNMALVLDRAYKAVYGQSLVEQAAGSDDVKVTDLTSAREETREAIQALAKLEITNQTNFRPNDSVTRGQFASFLYRTINVEGGEATTPETGEVTIASVKASAVNELTVEFNKSVSDTNAAAFAVKQGTTNDIKVSDIEWNEAKTVATLEVDHNFVAGTYNLTVTGVAEEALTASVTTTSEVATEIKFNSDKLVLTGAKKTVNTVEYNEARITFDVYNQYGETITEKTPTSYYTDKKLRGLKNDDTIAFSEDLKGLITVWIDKDEDEGEEGTISFTYERGDVEIDVDQDVVLSDDIEPGAVAVEGIYNINDRTLSAENVEKYAQPDSKSVSNLDDPNVEKFHILLTVKDQFGNPISAKESYNKVSGVTATSGDTGQIILNSIESGLRVDVSNNDIFDAEEDNIEVVNVDGKYYFAIPLEFEFTDEKYVKSTGENTVTFRSKATGEVTESKITLEGSAKVYSIGLSAPEEVVASEDNVKLPVTITDQNGNAVTNAAKLNKDVKDGRIVFGGDIQRAGSGGGKKDATFITEGDKLFLEFDAIANDHKKDNKEMDIEIEVEDSGQETELTLAIQPKAYPATLVKLSTGTAINIFAGLSEDIELGDIVIEDQYGRVYDDAFTGTQDIKVKGISGFLKDQSFTFVNDEFTIQTPSTKDSAVIEFTLESKDNEGKDITSKLSLSVRALEEKDFASFKVTADKAAFADFAGDKEAAEVEVFGVLANGKEVVLPTSAYTVKGNKYLTADYAPSATKDSVDVVVDETLSTRTEGKMNDDNVDVLKSSVSVVINRTGQVVNQEINASREDREITRLIIKDDESVAGKTLTKVTLTASEANSALKGDFLTELLTVAEVEARDQYGKKYKEGATIADSLVNLQKVEEFKFVINNVNSGNDNYVISLNGGAGAQVTGLSAGDSFDVAVKLDNAIQVIKVQVK